MTNEDAILEFPIGTRVRLSDQINVALGNPSAVADHGVGVVTGPVLDSFEWRQWAAGHGPCVMVQWPESRVPHAIVPASVRYLVRVEGP